ncbi:MAG: hypothetical protein NUV48_07050 [Peptococcaceae bacterium]|jgi:hypothetical protein|nr:hypothetical protein [Peptococcaceae bacterium]
MSLIEFLLIFVVIAYLSFQATDLALILGQHQGAKHLLKQYADRVRLNGRLSSTDETEFRNKMTQLGLTVESIDTQKESEGEPRILRSNDPVASTIPITVVCKPVQRPFKVGALIGGDSVGDSWRIRLQITVFSERIDP